MFGSVHCASLKTGSGFQIRNFEVNECTDSYIASERRWCNFIVIWYQIYSKALGCKGDLEMWGSASTDFFQSPIILCSTPMLSPFVNSCERRERQSHQLHTERAVVHLIQQLRLHAACVAPRPPPRSPQPVQLRVRLRACLLRSKPRLTRTPSLCFLPATRLNPGSSPA
jgi:hypothetical protein